MYQMYSQAIENLYQQKYCYICDPCQHLAPPLSLVTTDRLYLSKLDYFFLEFCPNGIIYYIVLVMLP